MKEQRIETSYKIYTIDELDAQEKSLMEAAIEATRHSYAPYSHFHVGAAVLLENDVIVTGSNQENVAYPSGLCAERTALFYSNSQYPDMKVRALAIAARSEEEGIVCSPIFPCGACRQVMLETEKRSGKPMKILLCGSEEVYIVKGVTQLLPFAFSDIS